MNWIKLSCFLLAILLQACNSKPENIVKKAGSIEIHTPQKISLKDGKVITYLKKYIESDSSNTLPKVYQLLIEEEDFETAVTINSTINFNTISHFLIIGYFNIDGNLVVIRSRLNGIIEPNAFFIEELKDVLRKNNFKDHFFKEPNSSYDCPVWKIEIKDDSVYIHENARNPDVRYVGKIDFDIVN